MVVRFASLSWQRSRPEDTSYKSIGCSAVPEKSSEMYLNAHSQGMCQSCTTSRSVNAVSARPCTTGGPAADKNPFKWILRVPLCSEGRKVPAWQLPQQCSSGADVGTSICNVTPMSDMTVAAALVADLLKSWLCTICRSGGSLAEYKLSHTRNLQCTPGQGRSVKLYMQWQTVGMPTTNVCVCVVA